MQLLKLGLQNVESVSGVDAEVAFIVDVVLQRLLDFSVLFDLLELLLFQTHRLTHFGSYKLHLFVPQVEQFVRLRQFRDIIPTSVDRPSFEES